MAHLKSIYRREITITDEPEVWNLIAFLCGLIKFRMTKPNNTLGQIERYLQKGFFTLSRCLHQLF